MAATDSPLRTERDGTSRLIAMASLFFILQCAVGVLRPIKNALALDGLGGTNFYRVYIVSAAVALFVPGYARLIERVEWRRLVPGVALFFVVNLVVMRVLYEPGSTVFGLVFYGWYDLFSAALISQFFLAAQYLVDAHSAKRAYPLVIAGGSIGAAAGGAITGFLAQTVGTPNLLLVAAAFILAFGLTLPLTGPGTRSVAAAPARRRVAFEDVKEIAADPHVRLIAAMVLATIVIKQLVDYQFNALTLAAFETPDRISAFQGKFNLATQWLPVVVLFVLRPLLRRKGVGVAVLMLPAFMLFANLGLAVFWSLWAAVFAKATETTLRYSAERAGREILYVPVPDDIKLKAKTYIDVALEEGIGKVVAAGLIFVLLLFVDLRGIAVVAMLLSAGWLVLGLGVRNEYVRTLARSIQGRYASVQGLFGSLGDATTWPLIRSALGSDDRLQTVFALELIEQSPLDDVRVFADDLEVLLDHPAEEIRTRVLALFERFPEAAAADAVRARLNDSSNVVREAAVRAVCAHRGNGAVEELLCSERSSVRVATLTCIARGEIAGGAMEAVRRRYDSSTWSALSVDAEGRAELALAAGTLAGDAEAERVVERLMDDEDPRVASTAMLAAATLRLESCHDKLIAALGPRETREAARTALATLGPAAVRPLTRHLLDSRTDPGIRRVLPSVLAKIPTNATVDALLRAVIAPETGQILDYRTIKALSKLRARHPELEYDTRLALDIVRREAAVAGRYAAAWATLCEHGGADEVLRLTREALADAWAERREGAFRCLGLVFVPEEVFRCQVALRAGPTERANALEWLEQTVGYSLFRELAPILSRDVDESREAQHAARALTALHDDEDPWIAMCAAAAAYRLGATPELDSADDMDLIETVFVLQRVDLLKDARSAHLALLAGIAEEITVERGHQLIREGQPTEALYVVTRGAVDLRGVGGHLTVGEGGAFGTWALIDDAPSPVEATAAETTRVLRIRREEFHDLVTDHPELAIGLLQGLARRIRALVA